MNMIGHDDVGAQYVVSELGAESDGPFRATRDFRIFQPKWAARCRVKRTLRAQELFSGFALPLSEM